MPLDPEVKRLRAENRKLRTALTNLADSIDGMAGEMYLGSMSFDEDEFVWEAAKEVNKHLAKARVLLKEGA